MLERLGLMPPQASTIAPQTDLLYAFLLTVSAFFTILIAVSVIGLAVVYRRRDPNQVTPYIHGSTALEITWSVIPLGIAMVIFGWGAQLFVTIRRPPDDALQVNVVGKQWMWKVQHMEGRREINELHVPVGRAVKVTLTSEDVIHSFYVPAFRIKEDAVPGRYNTAWFEATKVGRFHLFCAEYCGTLHSGMIGWIVVMDPADYQAWLAGAGGAQVASGGGAAGGSGEQGQSVAAAGQAVFEQMGCVTCHQPGSTLGPQLAGVAGSTVTLQDGSTVKADDDYIRESILTPTAKVVKGFAPVMPTFRGQVTEEQVMQLIAYIKSLGSGGSASGANAGAAGQGKTGS